MPDLDPELVPKRGGPTRMTDSERLAHLGTIAMLALREISEADYDHEEHERPWHPAPLGAACRLLGDWLVDTGQHDVAALLGRTEVVSPHTGADMTTLGELAQAELRAARSA